MEPVQSPDDDGADLPGVGQVEESFVLGAVLHGGHVLGEDTRDLQSASFGKPSDVGELVLDGLVRRGNADVGHGDASGVHETYYERGERRSTRLVHGTPTFFVPLRAFGRVGG